MITTRMEHPAILQTMAYLERQGFEVTYLPVDRLGRISLQDLDACHPQGYDPGVDHACQ